MNPSQCRIVLKPRAPLDVFDLGVRFARERWRPLAVLLAVTVLPPWLVLSVGAWLTDGHFGWLLAALVFAPALQIPFTMLAGRLLFQDEVRVRDVLRELLSRLSSAFAIAAGAAIAFLVAVATCGVGLIWAQGMLLYLPEILLLERVPLSRALRRSAGLAAGQLLGSITGVTARVVITLWMAALAESSGQALVGFVFQLGQPFGAVTTFQVTPYVLAGVLVAQPIFAVYRLLLYVDARTRLEGWDLQVGLWAVAGAR